MRKRVLAALRQPSLKLTIIAIVFVVLVPTLGVISATLYSASRSLHDAGARQLLETARTVASSTVSELELTGGLLLSLAQVDLHGEKQISRQGIAGFAKGEFTTHMLVRSEGQWHLGSDAVIEDVVKELTIKAAKTGRMQVSNILMPSVEGQPLRLLLAMPGEPSQNLLPVSILATQPVHLLHALTRRGGSGLSVILAITDGQGRIVERSIDSARFVGKPVPDWETVQAHAGENGAFTAKTLEGRQIIFAFQRIEGTPGWVAVVGESAASFNERWQRPIWVMLVASSLTICLALLLAMLFARKALKPIHMLATRAQRIAADQERGNQRLMADVPPTFVAEFEMLRQSLDQADQALQRSLQESRRAEHDAQEHLSVLQAAEEQARLGHWSLDVKSGQLKCSDMLSVLCGGARESMVMHVDALRAKLDAYSFQRLQEAVRKCIDHGEPYAMEIGHLHVNGRTLAAYLRGAPVFDVSGEVVGISGTLQDISEGKEQGDRLVALADNLPSGVIFRLQRGPDRKLSLQFLSAGLETLTGLSAQSLMRHQGPLICRIPAIYLRRLLRVLRNATLTGHVLDMQFPLHTRAGHMIWIHCRAALRHPSTGGAVWDGIARDVTSEREADEALRAAKEAAEVAERAKSDFLATMSHEIRTPMNSVIGMTRLTLRTSLNPRQRNYLEKINDSANVLLAIINDILDFSKIEAGGLVLEHVPLRLESVLNTVSSVTVLKAEEKGLEITYVVDSGVPTMVLGDSLRLGQVLTNLVSNAVKFTEVGDVVVRVSVYEEAGKQYLHFAVSDTGVGISPEQVSRLFQPFSQARTDTSRHYGGTGLGLVISKRLIEMMEGTIGVHSKLGIGSTFFFMVPLQAVDGTEETTVCSNTRTMSLQGRRILIADDNNTSRMALAEIAEGFGMEATLAGNGKEAIELLHQHAAANHPFDLVMLDWHMPTMDGAEAARLIKTDVQLERMPAVMMVTAYGQESMLQACQGVELQGVLHKPVTHSSMYDILLKASSVVNAVAGFPSLTGGEGDDLRVFAALQGKHVLVVDDNALNREVATDFLACVGVKVLTAGDGLAAIRCLESQDVDAVLMDIHMPHMNGLQATREIRRYARWKQLPIIALTAQARSEDVVLSREAGMNGHLSKPIDEIALYRSLMAFIVGVDSLGDAVAVDSSDACISSGPAKEGGGPFARLSPSPVRRAHLLRGFLHDFEDVPQRFESLLARKQWLELADLAHQIKGSASYLNATALCAIADIVEISARSEQGHVVQANAGQFVAMILECLESVRQALNELQDQQARGKNAPASMTWEAALDLIERVRPLVASGNFAAHRLLEQLVTGAEGSTWEAHAQAALDAFDDLDIRQCMALLETIAQQCDLP